jgi:hypothetical protein
MAAIWKSFIGGECQLLADSTNSPVHRLTSSSRESLIVRGEKSDFENETTPATT